MHLNKGLAKEHEGLDRELAEGAVGSGATQVPVELVQKSACKWRAQKLADGHP